MTPSAYPLVAVVGPTGSGKSELALRIAGEFGGEIINCDSLQIYRGLDIGTAKLTPAERRGIPHHLIDLLQPDQPFSAGEYARLARRALADIASRRRLPVVAGGTGFYLRALLEGLFSGPQRDPALRRRLASREARHPGWLHRLLARADPDAAGRIHPADVQKLVRACEILLLARRPLTALFSQGRDRLEGYRVLKLGLDPPRAELYARVDARCRRMFETGLVEEVQGLLRRGYPETLPPLASVGYKQAVQLLRGGLDRAQALEAAQRATRRYAKRQWTWFRRDAGIVWLRGFGEEPCVIGPAIDRVRALLAGGCTCA